MEKKMTFDVDRTVVNEGDIVEVRWNCTGAERVELKIDNGFKASVIELEITGTKRFRLNRSKGRTSLTITAWKDGHHGSKTLKVRVKEIPVTQAETVDDKGRHVGSLQEQWQLLRQRWKAMPSDKRIASRVSLILCGILLVGMLIPSLFMIGLLGLLIYLAYVVLKR